jgi:hypothetical protein
MVKALTLLTKDLIMKKISYVFIAAMSLLTTECFATLGESSASIKADHKLSTNNELYKVESYKVSSVTNIREYIAKDGIVFAVSWKGQFKPNLSELLGTHYRTLTNAIANKRHGGRAAVYINRHDIVIESNGHPGYFFGKAYLPAVMPSGMKESEIR